LEGSQDGLAWTILSSFANDHTYGAMGTLDERFGYVASFTIQSYSPVMSSTPSTTILMDGKDGKRSGSGDITVADRKNVAYRYIRMRHSGKNAKGLDLFMVSMFELYGLIFEKPSSPTTSPHLASTPLSNVTSAARTANQASSPSSSSSSSSLVSIPSLASMMQMNGLAVSDPDILAAAAPTINHITTPYDSSYDSKRDLSVSIVEGLAVARAALAAAAAANISIPISDGDGGREVFAAASSSSSSTSTVVVSDGMVEESSSALIIDGSLVPIDTHGWSIYSIVTCHCLF
jgi:hypothetical protein